MFILLLLHHRGTEATAATFCLFEVSQMYCMDDLVDPPRWRNLKFKKISSLYLLTQNDFDMLRESSGCVILAQPNLAVSYFLLAL